MRMDWKAWLAVGVVAAVAMGPMGLKVWDIGAPGGVF